MFNCCGPMDCHGPILKPFIKPLVKPGGKPVIKPGGKPVVKPAKVGKPLIKALKVKTAQPIHPTPKPINPIVKPIQPIVKPIQPQAHPIGTTIAKPVAIWTNSGHPASVAPWQPVPQSFP